MSMSRSSGSTRKGLSSIWLTSEVLLGEARSELTVEWASSAGNGDCCGGDCCVKVESKVPSTYLGIEDGSRECMCLGWASFRRLGFLLHVVCCDLRT